MKKFLIPALTAAIIVQLFVPVYMIADRYNTLKTGDEFKFKVDLIDPYDAFRGRYVDLNVIQEVSGDGKYGVIAVGNDGFAYIREITDEKPEKGAYVKSGNRDWFTMPIDRYYMDEKLAPEAETLMRQLEPKESAYVTVKVKNGKLVAEGLFVNNYAIEDIITEEPL